MRQSSMGWSYWEHPSKRVQHNGVRTTHNQMNYPAAGAATYRTKVNYNPKAKTTKLFLEQLHKVWKGK
jgi:hypothetical protein